jgi:hypothetical protein
MVQKELVVNNLVEPSMSIIQVNLTVSDSNKVRLQQDRDGGMQETWLNHAMGCRAKSCRSVGRNRQYRSKVYHVDSKSRYDNSAFNSLQQDISQNI